MEEQASLNLNEDVPGNLSCYASEDEEEGAGQTRRAQSSAETNILPVASETTLQSNDTHDPGSDAGSSWNSYNDDWIYECYQTVLDKVQTEELAGIKWESLLSHWSEILKDVAAENIGQTSKILALARLTKSTKPMSLEILRRLGKDILMTDTRNLSKLRERLEPTQEDSSFYKRFFGKRESWSNDVLHKQLEGLRGSNNVLKSDLDQEKHFKFIFSHVRSGRYHPVELGVILEHMIKDVDTDREHWKEVARSLRSVSAREDSHPEMKRTQDFILHCANSLHRGRQTLEGAIKRNFSAGVILFGDFRKDPLDVRISKLSPLEKEYKDNRLQHMPIKLMWNLVEKERDLWGKYKKEFYEGKESIDVKDQPLFSLLDDDTFPFSHAEFFSQIKTYLEKKEIIRQVAMNCSSHACVEEAIKAFRSDSALPSEGHSRSTKFIAVFGYKANMDSEGRGSKSSADGMDHSVIVRSVPLSKHTVSHGELELTSADQRDEKIFEIGLSIVGSYVEQEFDDSEDLKDMLRTSGLGISQQDRIHFFEFVPAGQYKQRAKPIEDLITDFLNTSPEKGTPHILLNLPDSSGRPGMGDAYADIADAGGRFLINLTQVGMVKTEGLQYHPLAMAPAASVALKSGKAIAFRRFAVLIPPSLPIDVDISKLGLATVGDAGEGMKRNRGFYESAAIVAEVLSLVAIDQPQHSVMDYEQKQLLIKTALETNPLLLYYTSIDLLCSFDNRTTDGQFISFAAIIAKYWRDKLTNFASFKQLSIEEQESRKMIEVLLTSSAPGLLLDEHHNDVNVTQALGPPETPSRGVAKVPAAAAGLFHHGPQGQGEKKVVVASDAHFKLLPDIIARETKFAQEHIVVEENNLESTLQKLKRASGSAATFFFVTVTGRISAQQLEHIMSTTSQVVKCIIRYSPSILNLLEITSQNHTVYRPDSINSARSSSLRKVAYTESMPVGAMVLHTYRALCEQPELLQVDSHFWKAQDVKDSVCKQARWTDLIQAWLANPTSDCDQNSIDNTFVKLVIAPDHAQALEQLKTDLCTLAPCCHIMAIDAGPHHSSREDLKSLLDAAGAQQEGCEGEWGRGQCDDGHNKGLLHKLVVVCNASYLPKQQLEALVTRCTVNRTKLVLLLTEASSDMSHFRVVAQPRAPPVWIRVSLVRARLRMLSPISVAFAGLQLMFSPSQIYSRTQRQMVDDWLKLSSPSTAPPAFLFEMQGIKRESEFVADMLYELACDSETHGAPVSSTLAQIMAMHVNRYIRFRSCVDDEALVSFSDFCEQPGARFLSQVHRVEAYMWFLVQHTQTDHVVVDEHSHQPLGLPICKSFKCAFANVHCSYSPGDCLQASFIVDPELRVTAAPSPLPPPEYIDQGKGDALTNTQEILQHRAIRGDELHWHEMYVKWQSGPEGLTSEALDHVFVHSASRLAVLLCLPLSQIINQTLSSEALDAIAHDLKDCAALFHHVPTDSCREVRVRAAAIWWLLMTNGRIDITDETFSEDQKLLLDLGIKIKPGEPISLLSNIARALIQMDNVEALTMQQAVWDFILDNDRERKAAVAELFSDESLALGSAFVTATCIPDSLNAISTHRKGDVVFGALQPVLEWVKNSSGADVRAMRDAIERLKPHLTPKAVSMLLQKANHINKEGLHKACDGFIVPCVLRARTLVHIDARLDRFLERVMAPLCALEGSQVNMGLAVSLLEVLAAPDVGQPGAEDDVQHRECIIQHEDELSGLGDLWKAIYVAFRQQTPDVCRHLFRVGRNGNTGTLPFETSDLLCKMYLQSLNMGSLAASDIMHIKLELDAHAEVLSSSLSKDAMFNFLERDDFVNEADLTSNHSFLALIWFVWWSNPWKAVSYLPTRETWPVFKAVLGKVQPDNALASRGLSTLARFAIAPHTLSASILNALKVSILGDPPVVVSKTLLLAQANNAIYPAYSFRVHYRPLPEACLKEIADGIKQSGPLINITQHQGIDRLKRCFPITHRGISVEIARHNLAILANMHSLERNKEHLGLTVIAWFLAAGFDHTRLADMGHDNATKSRIKTNIQAVKQELKRVTVSKKAKTTFTEALVFVPLPVNTDVRYVTASDKVQLFLTNEESASTTAQWLQSMALFYDLRGDKASEQFSKYAEDCRIGRNADRAFPMRLVKDMMVKIGKKLMNPSTTAAGSGPERGSSASLLERLVPIADFFAQLRIGKGERDSHTAHASPYVENALDGLTDGLCTDSKKLNIAHTLTQVSDAMYMLVGVTPENLGEEIMCMVNMWRHKRLTMSRNVVSEIEYMANKVYREPLPSLADKLLACLQQSLIEEAFTRSDASSPLFSFVEAQEATAKAVDFVYASIAQPSEIVTCIAPKHHHADMLQRDSPKVPASSGKHSAAQDNSVSARGNPGRSSYDHDTSDMPMEERRQQFVLFRKPCEDEVSNLGGRMHHVRSIVQASKALKDAHPQTVSARKLISLECSHWYGVLKVVPGLHPVLWSPGDWKKIPVSQQKSLGIDLKSFDRKEIVTSTAPSKIEAIFANNGGTWDRLNRLPAGSTVMGSGLYLRKAEDGAWVLLLGAATERTVADPPYALWMLMDTMKLAALDFDTTVVDTMRALACFARIPESLSQPDDKAFGEVLAGIRAISVKREQAYDVAAREKYAEEYLLYLLRENVLCRHVLAMLERIGNNSHQGQTVIEALQPERLEEDLAVGAGGATWRQDFSFYLGSLIGISDSVPRSQLIHTLKLVLRNHESMISDVIARCSNAIRDMAAHTQKAPEHEDPADDQKDVSVNDGNDQDPRGERQDQGQQEGQPNDQHDGNSDDDDQGGAYSTEADKLVSVLRVYLDGNRCSRGGHTVDLRDSLIVRHEHITQHKFRLRSRHYIRELEKNSDHAMHKHAGSYTVEFEDSDEEDNDKSVQHARAINHDKLLMHSAHSATVVEEVSQSKKDLFFGVVQDKEETYEEDSELDRPLLPPVNSDGARCAMFPSTWGYGQPCYSSTCTLSLLGEATPLYFWQIDALRLKMTYTDADGLPIAFVFHKRLLKRSLRAYKVLLKRQEINERTALGGDAHQRDSAREFKLDSSSSINDDNNSSTACGRLSSEDHLLAYREKLLRWLTDLVRSPLPKDVKEWFLDKLESGMTVQAAPILDDLNMNVIAHCIAMALPSSNDCKPLFNSAFLGQISSDFLGFCKRKNDLYGVHIVKGGTLSAIEQFGAVVEVCELGYDALTRSKDNPTMYLEIIGKFSALTWIVYVTGLETIDDALLKWLAEYTKEHPWRFVYLENTQTSWNFSENRDRCVQDLGPPPLERELACEEDLDAPAVRQLRPSHKQPYPRVKTIHGLDENTVKTMTWDEMSAATANFFLGPTVAPTVEASASTVDWISFNKENAIEEDFQARCTSIFDSMDPCVVLLCSPPGAGKSHFSDELKHAMMRRKLRRAFIDGSDDRLVDLSLLEILEQEVPNASDSRFLVVDEFHMLGEQHKTELFAWLQVHGRRLHVLLIANRKDSRDEELLESLRNPNSGIPNAKERVVSIQSRLGKKNLEAVMGKNRNKNKEDITRWVHCCRCLFGGESVSLRFINNLDDHLEGLKTRTGSPSDLIDLLLSKVPTVSQATAEEFVACFIAASEAARQGTNTVAAVAQSRQGPVSLMVQVALCTEHCEAGIDFPDFVSSNAGLRRAYDGPPALRIAAWCCHMRAAATASRDAQACREDIDKMARPESIFQCLLVDQFGFPLQLRDPCFGLFLSVGRAFSWNGDYSRMSDIIDAVKHGHSVDWNDVHERCWKLPSSHVLDSSNLVKLLSVCNSPNKVLLALTKDNLRTLLVKSPPDDALYISREVLRHQTHEDKADSDGFSSPYRTAVWMMLLLDTTISEPKRLVDLVCSDSGANDAKIKNAESRTADALIWASTYMNDTLVCHGKENDPRQRSNVLHATLVYLSIKLMASGDARVPALWHNMFAPFLGAMYEGPCAGKEDIIRYVAKHAGNVSHSWPQHVVHLWAVAHKTSNATQVKELWENHKEFFYQGCVIDSAIAAGILSINGTTLPMDLKIEILTTKTSVVCEDLNDAQQAIVLLNDAIQKLACECAQGDNRVESCFKLCDGAFRVMVLEEAHKYSGTANGLVHDM